MVREPLKMQDYEVFLKVKDEHEIAEAIPTSGDLYLKRGVR